MNRFAVWFAPFLFVLLPVPAAEACLWDSTTLATERSEFPGVLELITGKFPRHSSAYYEWRIEDRLAQLEAEPRELATILALRDDIAVGYDKLGRHDEAIAYGTDTLELEPDRYESHANLGTFLLHAGRFEDGLSHLRHAIEINPDAHFGREIYQIRLVEWVLEYGREDDGNIRLPIKWVETSHLSAPPAESDDPETWHLRAGALAARSNNFAAYLEKHQPEWNAPSGENPNLNNALHGVLGMMRFGNYNSPVLLEALGDLLLESGETWWEHARQLAARAYLHASYVVDDKEAAAAYCQLTRGALRKQTVPSFGTGITKMTLDDIERDLKPELAEAEAWFAELKANERRWIAEGADVEAKFAATYLSEPIYIEHTSHLEWRAFWLKVLDVALFALVAALIFAFFYVRSRRKRRKQAAEQAAFPNGG